MMYNYITIILRSFKHISICKSVIRRKSIRFNIIRRICVFGAVFCHNSIQQGLKTRRGIKRIPSA